LVQNRYADISGYDFLGQFTQAEVRSAQERADLVVTTKDAVFLFEFKLAPKDTNRLVKAALKQIDDKGYLVPYTAGNRKLFKIGAVFNTTNRTLGKWKAI
jgi:UDP-2,3-diacylglucosamine pyrophosphatase LpxH